ncbi:MAG: tRNA pseudouridine(38,39,40) synthase TruA [Desulfuromonadales bacterium C00003094]|jgi:tRNA pseudouridine38-40 synthase|nr:MAG: tRNA pseudouridine(38,39,40) synthase TruA [Desulfuromonadales bacterium C00003094]
MRTIKLTIEYDGSGYAGWQRQPNGLSVQQVVEEALTQLLGQAVTVYSSGRTDAGVHARGMVAHLQTERSIPLQAFRDGVNSFLPSTVAVQLAEEVPAGFHARFSAQGKWYRYSVYLGPVQSPLHGRNAWCLRPSLDFEAMQEAAALFVGRHDFAAFRTSGCSAKTTIRDIFAVDLQRQERLLTIDVKGSGFLRNMVRMMAGTLVKVGQGKRSPQAVADLLDGQNSGVSALTAPAHGLCLMEVWYDVEESNKMLDNFEAFS